MKMMMMVIGKYSRNKNEKSGDYFTARFAFQFLKEFHVILIRKPLGLTWAILDHATSKP